MKTISILYVQTYFQSLILILKILIYKLINISDYTVFVFSMI